MTQRQRMLDLTRYSRMVSEALRYTVMNRVTWLGPHMIFMVPGMPAKYTKVGLMRSTDPYAIIHHVDISEVSVLTPDQVALWPSATVACFAGLDAWLRENITIPPTSGLTHCPTDSWVRVVSIARMTK